MGAQDCDESDADTHHFAVELCDGADQNCDGLVDNVVHEVAFGGLPQRLWGEWAATVTADADVLDVDIALDSTTTQSYWSGVEIWVVAPDGLGAETLVQNYYSFTGSGLDTVLFDDDSDLSLGGTFAIAPFNGIYTSYFDALADFIGRPALGDWELHASGGNIAHTFNSASILVTVDGGADVDGDGFRACADCDDGSAAAYPGAPDACDGIDQDCDGDPADRDEDGDTVPPCAGDCNDFDASLNPLDDDGDGTTSCDGDCDDFDATVSPTAPEIFDVQDNDCDGLQDEDVCQEATVTCNTAVGGYNGSGSGDLGVYDLNSCGSFSAQWEESIYRLIAPYTGTLQATLDTWSEFGHSMYVLEGDCSPDSCVEGGGNWFSVPMVAGQTYYIIVEQDDANAPSTFDFDITCAP